MAKVVFKIATEAAILALAPTDSGWVERAFYYPDDKDYFYQALNGTMRPFGKAASESVNSGEGVGVGIKLNGKVIGGVKTNLSNTDSLDIPQDWDYNTRSLTVRGQAIVRGQINIF